MKTLFALISALVLVTALAERAPGQDESRLSEVLTACRHLRVPEAASRLLVMRREEPTLVRPLIVLGRQAKAAGGSTATAEQIAAWSRELAELARIELAAPARAILALDAMLAGIEDAADRELLAAFDRALHLRIADAAIERFLDRGAFDGMFATFFSGRPRVARAFMDHFLDRLNDVGYRGYAAQGAAELAAGEQKKIFAAEAAQIWAQVDEDAVVRRGALILMKRCGRDREFDEAVTTEELKVAAILAQEPGKRAVGELLVAYENLVDLLGRAGLRANALQYDEAYCRLLLGQCSYETQGPEARRGIAAALYDFSCRLATADALDAADFVLDLALGWGFADLSWIDSDPELASLRARPTFAEKIAAWRKNEDRSRAAAVDLGRWERIVAAGVASAVKRVNAAKPAADTPNDKQESKP